MSDIIAALVAILQADAATAARCAGHVYGAELPAAATRAMPRPALLIQPTGGAPMIPPSSARIEAQRFDLFAYGATPAEANALRQTAAQALVMVERRAIAGTLIHWINSAGGFFAARERDGLWPTSFQSFQTLYATQEIAP